MLFTIEPPWFLEESEVDLCREQHEERYKIMWNNPVNIVSVEEGAWDPHVGDYMNFLGVGGIVLIDMNFRRYSSCLNMICISRLSANCIWKLLFKELMQIKGCTRHDKLICLWRKFLHGIIFARTISANVFLFVCVHLKSTGTTIIGRATLIY